MISELKFQWNSGTIGPQPILHDFKTISQVNDVMLLIIQQGIPLFVSSPCDFVIKTESFDCIF